MVPKGSLFRKYCKIFIEKKKITMGKKKITMAKKISFFLKESVRAKEVVIRQGDQYLKKLCLS